MFVPVTGKIIRYSLSLVLMLLVVTAFYVGMGRILMANIDQYRVEIVGKLSEMVKLPVKIDKLAGSFYRLDPILELHGLTLGHPAQPVIRLGFMRVRLNIIKSLRQGSIVIEDINVSGLYLNLMQDHKGVWRVEGLPAPRRRFQMHLLWDFLTQVGSIRLAEAHIGIKTDTVSYVLHSHKKQVFALTRHNDTSQLSLVMQWQDRDTISAPEEFILAGSYKGDPRRADFSASLYLKLPTIDLASFLPSSVTRNKLQTLTVDGQYWLRADQGEILVRGSFGIHELRLKTNESSILISDAININLGLVHVYNKGTSIHLNSVSGHWLKETFDIQGISALLVPVGINQFKLGLQLPDVSLKPLSRILIPAGRKISVIDMAMTDRLQGLAIEGKLIQPKLFVDFSQETPYYEFMSEVRGLYLHPSGAIPGVSKLDGFVAVRPGAGYFDVHTERPFTVKYAALFAESWLVGRGNFRTHFIQSDVGLHVFSDIVEVSHGKSEVRGKFTLNLHKDRSKRSWGLEIGIKNADLSDAYQFLPYVMPDKLRDWLQRSVLAGTAIEGGLVFHGPLGKQLPRDQKVFEIYLKVKDVIFDYDRRWPRLDDLAATLYIGNKEIYSDDVTGRMFDSKILLSEVRVPISSMSVDTILIKGQVTGSVSDGLRLLTETPLNAVTNQVFEGWQGEGEMLGRVQLDIPLGKRKPAVPWAHVNISLNDADIYMPQYNLSVEHLTGKFRYESESGINAPKFTASLFDQPVSGWVNTSVSPAAIKVRLDGRVNISDLQKWSGQSLLTRLAGVMSYKAHLHIPRGKSSGEPVFVEVTSSLEGVAINLPQPMKKDFKQPQNLTYQQSFMHHDHKVELKLDGKVAASIKLANGILTGGRVHFGTTDMGVIAYDKLRVSGQFEDLVYAEWRDLIVALANKSGASIETELVAKLASINVKASRLNVLGTILKNGELEITRSDSAWKVKIHNEILDGMVILDDDPGQPLDIKLNYLHLGPGLGNGDPLGPMDPRQLAAFRLSVDSVLLDKEDYGQWSFEYSPQEQGGLVNIESANVRGLAISKGAKVIWNYKDGAHSSKFEGEIFVSDVSDALKRWGFASSIQGQEFDFLANVSWDGSPAMIGLMTVKGLIELRGGHGKFVQAKANLTTLKLIGIFDFASLMRRFRLDFSDVIEKGFVFNEMYGSVRTNHGIIDVVDPVFIKGSGSTFKLGGRIDLVNGTLDNDIIVTLPVNRNLPWYAAYSAVATGPLTGLAIILGQKIFRHQIDAISSAKYKISGSLDEPHIKFVAIFNDSVREASAGVPVVE